MKTKFIYCMPVILGLMITGCEGEQGPQGPPGPQGTDGNAEVTQYIFGEHDFSTSSSVTWQIPDISSEEMYESAWLTYLVRPAGNIYPIPGYGVNGSSEYRIYVFHSGVNVNFAVVLAAGTGEIYAETRIVQIPASDTVNLKTSVPDIDFSDYYAVADYYGLEY